MKTNPIRFRPASSDDLPRIMEIIRQAQRRMAAAGSDQWQDGYPAPENIASDLAHGYGLVACRGQEVPDREAEAAIHSERGSANAAQRAADPHEVIAYGAVVFDGEPAYEALEGGQWLSEGPYVVVHRLAVADEALGESVGTWFLREVERMARQRGIGSFRVDTNFDNHRMLRILAREGFTRCGTVRYRSGEREAFEKRLS